MSDVIVSRVSSLQAASDTGVGAWGSSAGWQQQRQGLVRSSVSGIKPEHPLRADSEAGMAGWDAQTGVWQPAQKPGVSRMSIASLHSNDIAPAAARRYYQAASADSPYCIISVTVP